MMNKTDQSLFEYYDFNEQDGKNYPVISRILKELTPKKIKDANEEVARVNLPDEFYDWVHAYNEIGEKSRNEYFWKWLYRVVQTITLPAVPQKFRGSIFRNKIMMIFFVTLFDDVADKHNVRNQEFLNDLLDAPFRPEFFETKDYSDKNKKHMSLMIKTWRSIKAGLAQYPQYKEIEDIFDYDTRQLLNAMRYSYLVNNQPALINSLEYWTYLPHNMQAIISLDIDLMALNEFNFDRLGIFREIAHEAQKMARIGNWISTWEREVHEKDYTSAVFAYALEAGAITINDLRGGTEEDIIAKIEESKANKAILINWQESYSQILEKSKEINVSLGLTDFLNGLEKLLTYHLSSRGYK